MVDSYFIADINTFFRQGVSCYRDPQLQVGDNYSIFLFWNQALANLDV